MEATLTFLGTGTSMGIPTLGCECVVCASATPSAPDLPPPSPHNRRTRPSVLISWRNHDQTHNVVIDTGPDFHAQAIRAGIRRLDAVLYTHGHADHVLGMDDLRPLSFYNPAGLPLYADEPTAATIERIFDYTFRKERRYPTSARVVLHRLSTEPGTHVDLYGASFQRIPVTHGQETITGYRFGSAAYLTDISAIPTESLPLLAGLDVLILDALRREPHPTHSTLANSIALVEQLKPRRAFFTHMSHDLDHEATNAALPPHIRLAYDGLQITFDIAPARCTYNGSLTHLKIYRQLAEVPASTTLVVATIGNFDGVHLGHQGILAEVHSRARFLGGQSLAITFDPHPNRVLRPEHPLRLITLLPRKLELLAATGIDATLVLPFTDELRRLYPREFVASILVGGLRVTEVHEGDNFNFGYRAPGSPATDNTTAGLESLGRELGFRVTVYSPCIVRGAPVSSSRIRKLIGSDGALSDDNRLSHARALLGRPFSIDSTPAPGRGYGAKYTVATINLAPYAELLPANGVYVTTLTVGAGGQAETFDAVTNVGNRPTFGADSFAVESHLLNFHPLDLAEDTPLRLTFLRRLRAERPFPTTQDLRDQIARDVTRARRYFALCRKLA